MDLVSRFADLFEGRKDAYGADHGECVRVKDGGQGDVWWLDLFKSHLDGQHPPIGVYPVVEKTLLEPIEGSPNYAWWAVKWGCVDIDTDDLPLAINLKTALNLYGIRGHIELSRSKGYHVWVFAESWCTAATMRRALLAAHELVGARPNEVNPKQERLQVWSQLGNYVRLPYPGGLQSTPQRRSVYNVQGDRLVGPLSLRAFLEQATSRRATAQQLEELAKLYVEPRKPTSKLEFREGSGSVTKVLTDKLNGLAWTLYDQGPADWQMTPEGGGRSAYLFKLAVGCKESGLAPAEALTIVSDADARWGQKYCSRADGEVQLRRTVERAYSV